MNRLDKILRPTLSRVLPYNAGLSLDEVKSKYGLSKLIKLASNENPAGPAPELVSAMRIVSSDLSLYPDTGSGDLVAALAEYLCVSVDHLLLGNGSEELISIICRSVVEPGDRVITLYPSFPLHEDYAILMGANIERISLNELLEIDLSAVLEAVTKPAKMLIFSNPMNPVGTWLSPDQLSKVIAAKHPDTLLVLDEAYYEYAIAGDYKSGRSFLTADDSNWITLRTFSKAWGLAGLRIGYGVCSSTALCQALNLNRTPFNINTIAQTAATLALQHQSHMEECAVQTGTRREWLSLELRNRGYHVPVSLGNFVFFDVGRPSNDIAELLVKRGTIIKPWKQSGYNTFIRVSIGSEQENRKFLNDLDTVLPNGASLSN